MATADAPTKAPPFMLKANHSKAPAAAPAAANHIIILDPKSTSRARPMKKIANISDRITYSGFPSSHKLMTIRGRVAGYGDKEESGKQIILHTYGWFGCSGSVIYNASGEIMGVLWGVDAEYYPTIAIIEDMIWVVPIQELDIEKPIKLICKHNKMKFC